jgi:hypothetical protein
VQGPEYIRAYQRNGLMLEFAHLDDGALASMFLNMGDGRVPGRRSRFFRAWTMANGSLPKKGQVMTLETFVVEGLLYTLQVDDCRKDEVGTMKSDALVYSRVTEITDVVRK